MNLSLAGILGSLSSEPSPFTPPPLLSPTPPPRPLHPPSHKFPQKDPFLLPSRFGCPSPAPRIPFQSLHVDQVSIFSMHSSVLHPSGEGVTSPQANSPFERGHCGVPSTLYTKSVRMAPFGSRKLSRAFHHPSIMKGGEELGGRSGMAALTPHTAAGPPANFRRALGPMIIGMYSDDDHGSVS